MKTKIVMNPYSAGGKTAKKMKKYEDYFKDKLEQYDFVTSKSLKHFEEVILESLKSDYQQIVVIGGDGSISHAVNSSIDHNTDALINKDTIFSIAKSGTGSDFFKTLTLNKNNKDWKDIAISGKPTPFNVGKYYFLDSSEQQQTRYFINMLSFGLPALVSKSKEALPNSIPKVLKYIAPTVTALKDYKPQEIEINSEEFNYRGKYLGLFVSKGRFAGGGMKFAESVGRNDGLFEVTLVKDLALLESMTKLPKLYLGNIEDGSKIIKFMTPSLEIITKNVETEVDGEYIGQTSGKVTLIKESILFKTPIS